MKLRALFLCPVEGKIRIPSIQVCSNQDVETGSAEEVLNMIASFTYPGSMFLLITQFISLAARK